MKIDRNSWHYRLMRTCYKIWNGNSTADYWFDKYDAPTTLCAYFWGFWSLLIKASLTISALALVILAPTVGYVALGWSAFHNNSNNAFIGFFCVSVGYFVGLIIVLFRLLMDWWDRLNHVRALCSSEPLSFFHVCLESIKAAKNKFCPIIEYTDNKEVK